MVSAPRANFAAFGNPEPEIITPSSTKKKEKKKRDKKRSSSVLDSSIEENNTTNVAEIMHEGNTEFVTDEPTMEEKLATLDLVNDAITKGYSKSESGPESLSALQPPSAGSVQILLKQALHADDHALLLECLYSSDEKVIGKSISLLNPADVMKLLKSLLSMIQLRGAVLICVIPWLRSLISQHASSIVSQESSLLVLNSLYQLIQSRISTFGSAIELSTSLDYLSKQIGDKEESDEDNIAPIIYEDKDSEDEESEDAMETDNDNEETEGLGDVIDASHDSDGSEVMSDE